MAEPVRLSRRAALTALGGVPLSAAAAALGLPVSAALAGCGRDSWTSLPPTTLTIATGNRGGVFSRYGTALGQVLERRLTGVTTRTRVTNASVENLRLVGNGICGIGLSLADAAADAIRGRGSFDDPLEVVALARTYDSFVHLVVLADSGITTPAGLRGRRVGLGAPGSGTRVVATRILRQAGLAPPDIEVRSDSLEVSAAALRAGRLDAFFFVSGIPNQAVLTLARQTRIRLVPLESVVAGMVSSYGPEYVDGPIPASTYALPEGVATVSVRNFVIADPAMTEGLAYAVTRVMFEAQDEIDRLAPDVGQPNVGAAIFTSPLDLHPGALRYFRERRP